MLLTDRRSAAPREMVRQRVTALLKARWMRTSFGLAAFVVVGWLAPVLYVRQIRVAALVADGSHAGAADRMAEQAEAAALAAAKHPLNRLFMPHRAVTDIWRDPGHCAADEPGGSGPDAAYRATVRSFGWFAIPGLSNPRPVCRCVVGTRFLCAMTVGALTDDALRRSAKSFH